MTERRLAVWGSGLLGLSWLLYLHTMMVPGLADRAGRFQGSDYVYFYVSGSLVLDGRADALYDAGAHLAEARRRIRSDLGLYAAHPNYGPQIALLFAPLARLPFGASLAVFLAITTAIYGLSVWLIWRECPALRSSGWLVALLAAASPLFLALVRYGQLSALTLFFFAAAFAALSRGRRFSAGLAIGCLAYKPPLGIVLGCVMLLSREWRVVAGALTTAVGQLVIAWAVAGTAPMRSYGETLWTLAQNPGLVQIFPSEVHAVRGFLHLLLPWPAVVSVGFILALAAILLMAVRTWSSSAPLSLRYGQLIVLTVLGSPHLQTYDLVLLSVPLLVCADWVVANPDHRLRPSICLLLVGLYLTPFSSNLARLTHVQLSVVVMAALAWFLWRAAQTSTGTPRFADRSPRS